MVYMDFPDVCLDKVACWNANGHHVRQSNIGSTTNPWDCGWPSKKGLHARHIELRIDDAFWQDPRPSMTRTQRLQADKRRPPSSQSMRNNMQTPEIRKGRVAPTA